jgi:uncharacterized protein (TIGR02444 family)
LATAEPESEALWHFSLEFYAAPGMAEALIALQDQEGLDVNLMLFALWFGLSGRGRLDRNALSAAEQAVRAIRTDVVEPLRSLRRRLRNCPDEDVQHLREGVKVLELEGEKLVQARLARLVGAVGAEGPPLQRRLAEARANFALYLGPERARIPAAGVVLGAIGAFAHGPVPIPPPRAAMG